MWTVPIPGGELSEPVPVPGGDLSGLVPVLGGELHGPLFLEESCMNLFPEEAVWICSCQV